jgi:dTDP-4-amino-4,6-dideoxygalactose transaminase
VRVPFSYLDRQFEDLEPYFDDLRALVRSGDFTLGQVVTEFETRLAATLGLPHAVGVGTGTDALALALEAAGVKPGDEVITCAQTFIATVGAIVQIGARPVLVDSDDGFVIDPAQIEAAVTPRCTAILPVHYTGNLADMPAVMAIAERHHLTVVEDACQAIGGALDGKPVGSWGVAAGLSFHPLKNINVWGDAGAVVTREAALDAKLRLLRNHGLANRDEVVVFGRNCRLDSLQAVVGNRLVGQLQAINDRRIGIAQRYDEAFGDLGDAVRVPARRPGVRHVFHLYILRVERRDELLGWLVERGIEAKVHYPRPLHLQPAFERLGYRRGDFPRCEADAECIVTLPAHPYLSDDEVAYTIDQVRAFYRAEAG